MGEWIGRQAFQAEGTVEQRYRGKTWTADRNEEWFGLAADEAYFTVSSVVLFSFFAF